MPIRFAFPLSAPTAPAAVSPRRTLVNAPATAGNIQRLGLMTIATTTVPPAAPDCPRRQGPAHDPSPTAGDHRGRPSAPPAPAAAPAPSTVRSPPCSPP